MYSRKAKELSVNGSNNHLDLQLQLLHNFLFNLCCLSDEQLLDMKKQLRHCFTHNSGKVKELINNCDNQNFMTCNPHEIFQHILTNPLFKESILPLNGYNDRTSKLYNKDLIIG